MGDIATSVLGLCAVAVTGLLAKREFFPTVPPAAGAFREVSDWKSFSAAGNRLGAESARVTIVEFSDFQCPFCKESARQIRHLLDSVPTKFTYVYRHFPLTSIHPHAVYAAIASECAARVGKFQAYHDELFAFQDSIGVRSWTAFALRAGILDTTGFRRCMQDTAAVMPRIRADIGAGSKLGVNGTPAILVQGRLFSGLPSADDLRQALSRASK